MWRTTTHALTDPAHKTDLLDQTKALLLGQIPPDTHLATLLMFTQITGLLDKPKYTRPERRQRDKQWATLFGDYWGDFPVDHPIQPIPGLTPQARQAIGEMVILLSNTYVSGTFSQSAVYDLMST